MDGCIRHIVWKDICGIRDGGWTDECIRVLKDICGISGKIVCNSGSVSPLPDPDVWTDGMTD